MGFWTFFLARLGVGIFEAAGAPALNALCADCFSADRRSIAASVVTVGYWAGAMVGVTSGGIIADHAGWRAAFYVAGIPGLLLAPVAFRYLREPRPSREVALADVVGGAAFHAYRALLKKRGFRNLLIAIMILALWYWGTASWYVTLLVRSYHLSLSQAAFAYGTLSGISTLVGVAANAVLGDRLVRRDVRWLAWLPGAGVVGCLLFAIPVCLVNNSTWSLVLYLIASAFTGVIVPAQLAATYAFAGSGARASGVAAYYFCFYLVGLGFGAATVGALSDRFAAAYAQDSLRMALLVVTAVLPLSAWFFFRSAKHVAHDVEQA
jgi:MFS family permease